MTLTLLNYNTGAVIATTTTNGNGEYIFQVFEPGSYQIFQKVISILRVPGTGGEESIDFGVSPVR